MIAVIDYGVGNLRSVQKAFEAIGMDARITNAKSDLKNASHIVLPGVGAVGDALDEFEKYGLLECMRSQIKAGKPFLGICLGMQMMLSKSYENGEYKCFDIIKGDVVRFKTKLTVPHIGWNAVRFEENALFKGIKNGSFVYFVHSYHADRVAAENTLCVTDYDYDFVSGIYKDNVYGLQFHPEKSGDTGLMMLKNFGGMK